MNAGAFVSGLLFAIAWSSAFTAARIGVAHAPPFLLLSVRFFLSGLIALALGWALGQRLDFSARQWRGLVIFGLCQNAIYLGLNFEAMRNLEASLAAIIASLLPLIVAALGVLVNREKLGWQTAIGLVLGLIGVFIIMWVRIDAASGILGVALCLMGVMSLAIATLMVRGLSDRGNLWMILGCQMIVASLALLPVSLLLEQWVVDWSADLYLAFAYMIFVPGLGATMIWFMLVRQIGATKASAFHFLNPFLGLSIAALVLGESMTWRDILGVVVIMAGIVMVQRARSAAR